LRIALAGLAHEALTFFPRLTRAADFDIWDGDQVLEFPGTAGLAQELDVELIPIMIAQTRSPGGCVEYATFRDRIVDGIARAGDLAAKRAELESRRICERLSGSLCPRSPRWRGEALPLQARRRRRLLDSSRQPSDVERLGKARLCAQSSADR
jgi:hypothetical protein